MSSVSTPSDYLGEVLIETRFHHYERMADTQTLAMLTCVFSEPSNKGGLPNALMGLTQQVRSV